MQRRTFFRTTFAAAAAVAIPVRPLRFGVFQDARRTTQDLQAVTGDGRMVTLTSSAIADFANSLRGNVLLRGDAGYDDARRILSPSFDKYPALVAQPRGVADIRAAIDFARDNGGLLLAVKCGGHSPSGQSTCDRGMVIDLSLFRDVRIDAAARSARVTGGSLLGAVDHEAMSLGLVMPLGTVSHTGVGGLVTGGGFGRLARRYGLSVDNLISVDVVTADGQLRHASASDNADLFWGVRGGGGNFGIVTSFEFRLHPMQRQVIGGEIVFPFQRAKDVLALYAEYGPQAPDELQLDCAVVLPPTGQPGIAAFRVCWSGPPEGADRALAPVRRLGSPIVDAIQPMDYVMLQRSGDVTDPRAVGSYIKSGFIPSLPTALINAIVDRFEAHPERTNILAFQHAGGAIGRVASAATAFSQRDAQANMLCFVNWQYGMDPTEHITWIKDYWTGLEPFTHGFYVNDVEADMTAQRVQENYRQNHDRLVQVKNRYDPNNLFRLNANVAPTA
jgi:FAD/FMN-containing dehydrogenase